MSVEAIPYDRKEEESFLLLSLIASLTCAGRNYIVKKEADLLLLLRIFSYNSPTILRY